jgi:hypothetical protein
VLIVSDPLHMKRAMTMATDVGLLADPSPTPSTRYQGMRSQAGLLAHETYYYFGYLLSRPSLPKWSWSLLLHELRDAVDEHLHGEHHQQHSHQAFHRNQSSFLQQPVEKR